MSVHGPAPPPEDILDLKSSMKPVILAVIAAVGTPEATGSANETVQLPHWGDVPLSVTLTLAIVAPARVGVGFGEATALGPAVSAGVAAPSAGVGTGFGPDTGAMAAMS